MTTDMQTIMARVERLERQNRRMKLVVVSMVVVVGAGLLMGQASPTKKVPKVITAEKFRVVDKDGNLRIGLGVEPDGSPRLMFIDEDGKTRIGLYVERDDSTGMVLNDKDEKGGIELRVLPDGSPGLVLKDKDGKVVRSLP